MDWSLEYIKIMAPKRVKDIRGSLGTKNWMQLYLLAGVWIMLNWTGVIPIRNQWMKVCNNFKE